MKLSVLGCGWLGFPLAEKFIHNGHEVKGSVTSTDKFTKLSQAGIKPFLVDLNTPDLSAINAFLAGSEAVIVCIPPKIKSGDISYPDKLQLLVPLIIASGIEKVLFTSSVSVYGESVLIPVADESTVPVPTTESGKQVLAAERVLYTNQAFKTTILRLGGLIGDDRHPVYHLAGRTNVTNPDAPVNLVSRDECMAAITSVLEKNVWGEIFTVVHPQTDTREQYYTRLATKMALPVPIFNKHDVSLGKRVLGADKLKGLLGFDFK